MFLKEILDEKAIATDIKARDKEEAIVELSDLLCKAYGLKNKEKISEAIAKREKLGSTGMGHGIAIPHCKIEGIDRLYLGIGISKSGLDFKALDGESVYLFFILIAPASEAGPHLKALARISRLLRDEYFCRSLRNTPSAKNIFQIVITDDEKV